MKSKILKSVFNGQIVAWLKCGMNVLFKHPFQISLKNFSINTNLVPIIFPWFNTTLYTWLTALQAVTFCCLSQVRVRRSLESRWIRMCRWFGISCSLHMKHSGCHGDPLANPFVLTTELTLLVSFLPAWLIIDSSHCLPFMWTLMLFLPACAHRNVRL